MTNRLKLSIFLVALLSLLAFIGCAQSPNADNGYANERVLILAEELQAVAGQVKIIDVRSAKDYAAGHIPGAIHIERKAFENPDAPVDGTIATPEQMNRLLSATGISNNDKIVVYAGVKASPQMATRFWWVMDIYGHKGVRVLDGGIESWTALDDARLESGKGKPLPKTDYHVKSMDLTQLAFKEDVLNHAPDVVLLDVRALEEYDGSTVSAGAGRGGRIPGAVHLFFKENLDDKGFYKSAVELKKMYAAKGITADTEVIVYCMRAHRASHTMLALRELLGYKKVRGYNGAWMEWSNIPSLPIVKGNDK